MKRWKFAGLLVLLGTLGSFVVAQETKGIAWKYGLSFQVRKAEQINFTATTPKVGTEVFLDKDINQLVYIAETASIGLGSSAKLKEGPNVDPPLLYHAVEVKVRPAGEDNF